jgi:hypothetical protein
LKLYIPIAEGQTVNEKVTAPLELWEIDYETVATPGIVSSQRNFSPEKHKCEAACRMKIIAKAKELCDAYVVMMDRDVVLDESPFEDMAEYLKRYEKVGAVSLFFGNKHPTHIDIKCTMFKMEVLVKCDLLKYGGTLCTCDMIRKEVEKQGFAHDLLSDKIYGHELL